MAARRMRSRVSAESWSRGRPRGRGGRGGPAAAVAAMARDATDLRLRLRGPEGASCRPVPLAHLQTCRATSTRRATERAEAAAFDDDAVPLERLDDPNRFADGGSGPASEAPSDTTDEDEDDDDVIVLSWYQRPINVAGARHRLRPDRRDGRLADLRRPLRHARERRRHRVPAGHAHPPRAGRADGVHLPRPSRHQPRTAHGRPQHRRRPGDRHRTHDPDAARHARAGGGRDRRGDGLDGPRHARRADAGHGHRGPAARSSRPRPGGARRRAVRRADDGSPPGRHRDGRVRRRPRRVGEGALDGAVDDQRPARRHRGDGELLA